MPSVRPAGDMAARSEDPINDNEDGTCNAEEQAEISCIADPKYLRHCRMRTMDEACRMSVCARMAHVHTNGHNCNQLRSVCKLQTRHNAQDSLKFAIATNKLDLESRDSDPYRLVELCSQKNYDGNSLFGSQNDVYISRCINSNWQPNKWTSLRLNPPINYHCTFFDLLKWDTNGKFVSFEGGFESTNLRLFPDNGYWYQNIRSFRCDYGHLHPRSQDLTKSEHIKKHYSREALALPEASGGSNLNKYSSIEQHEPESKREADNANTAHLMTIWSEPIYAGGFAWVYPSQMIAGECIDLGTSGWASLRMYPSRTVYHCVIYDTAFCAPSSNSVYIGHGETGYDIPHLGFFLDGSLWHNLRSVQCRAGMDQYLY